MASFAKVIFPLFLICLILLFVFDVYFLDNKESNDGKKDQDN